ncbi:sulfotransferase [Thalassobaculum sp. OXR-137]|uniref:sulfotransferase family protein n=1 Tax=Thalassobaculum sp. OXR-137 TaxID=3100173 RepID=UPI002AC91F23|nr:sulfotransferase [Thalassobaculum sp. OXR-137]WPZ36173.1 sulfotransferase [Thalassobaculum sp. OXR-137]
MSEEIEAVIRRLYDMPVFFVAGLPRSGTTWLQQMLNAHPQLLCLGESHFINDMVPGLYNVLWNFTKSRKNPERTWAPGVVGPQLDHMIPVLRMAFASLAAANLGERDIGALRAIGEKNPDNLYHAERIWRVFPDARIVHIIRDPRDGAISGFTRFRARLSQDLTRTQYVAAYAKDWASRIATARGLAKDRPYMEIRYEDLHADTSARAAEIFRFIGASDDPSDVTTATEAASFERLSGGRKQGEVDPASHYRRGEVGGWRDEMTPEEVSAAERAAGRMMAAMGYEVSAEGLAAALA